MPATIYRSIEVYTAPPACRATGEAEVASQEDFVIVFAEVEAGSGGQSAFQWQLDFCGSVRNFSLVYCRYLANAIQDGLVYISLSARAGEIYGLLGEMVQNAVPLTAHAMCYHGHDFCCWSPEQAAQIRGEHDLRDVEYEEGTGHRIRVETDADVRALIQQARQISADLSANAKTGLPHLKSTPSKCEELALLSVRDRT